MRTSEHQQNQSKKPESAKLTESNTGSSKQNHHTYTVLHLQRTIGNRAVRRLLQATPKTAQTGTSQPGKAPALFNEAFPSTDESLDQSTQASTESRFRYDLISQEGVNTNNKDGTSVMPVWAISHARPAVVAQSENTSPIIQRTPPKQLSVESRLTKAEQSLRVLAKQSAALRVDSRWRATFGKRLASRKQAVLRVSRGLDTAVKGFQSAQIAQAQTDALLTQIIGGVSAVVFAFGFEWMAGAALGQLGMQLKKIEDVVEIIENPVNAAVSASVNIAGVQTSKRSAEAGQTPTGGVGGGSAMGYLTQNLEVLENHSELIEQAFENRAENLNKMTDEQWEKFDTNAVEKSYEQLLVNLDKSGEGVELMKKATDVGDILERHLWALWLRSNIDSLRQAHDKTPPADLVPEFGPYKPEEGISIGTDIELRLNAVSISKLAGIELTGHWYSSNSPVNWKEKLAKWANAYDESLSNKE